MTGDRTDGSAMNAVPANLLKLISYETLRRYGAAPLGIYDGRLRLAMANPSDVDVSDDIRVRTGYDVDVVKAPRAEIDAILHKNFGDLAEHPVCPALSEAAPSGAEHGAVQMVDRLVALAVGMRASDIHLEPQRAAFFVRFRIDGVLRTIHEFPKTAQAAITSRIKVLGEMDISEKRLPHDGQIVMRHGGRDIDLRVSTMPGKYGEKLVIRILDKSGLSLGLENLGFEPAAQGIFESLIERPYGIILVTGPTGSGKTTTLYSILNRIRSPLKNVITLEDPVEYELLAGGGNEMGVTQVQVHPKIGLTFAAGLRSALRQDPDVIMVGEIRDRETAETAMSAAMTGHLVLSSLHTNDAPSALCRLTDMGIEPYLINTTVIGVLAQRLVRVLCPRCKEAYSPPLRALKNMFPGRKDISGAVFYRPKGCDYCQETGYWGRHGVFELLTLTEEIKDSLQDGGNLAKLRIVAIAQGMRSLRDSGMELVFKGLTTVEEVARVTVE